MTPQEWLAMFLTVAALCAAAAALWVPTPPIPDNTVTLSIGCPVGQFLKSDGYCYTPNQEMPHAPRE